MVRLTSAAGLLPLRSDKCDTNSFIMQAVTNNDEIARKEKNRTMGVDDLDSTNGTNTRADSSGSAVKTVYTGMNCSASDPASFRKW